MNDDIYSRDLHAWIEPEIEARVIALILGEASDFEADELERLMEERPEIRIFKRRLESVHGLLGVALAPPDDEEWKLAPKARAELFEAMELAVPAEEIAVLEPTGTGGDRERRIRKAGRRVMWSAAACFAITLFLFTLLRSTKLSAPDFAVEGEKRDVRAMDNVRRQEGNKVLSRENAQYFHRETDLGRDFSNLATPDDSRGRNRDGDGVQSAEGSVRDKLAKLKDNLRRYEAGAAPEEGRVSRSAKVPAPAGGATAGLEAAEMEEEPRPADDAFEGAKESLRVDAEPGAVSGADQEKAGPAEPRPVAEPEVDAPFGEPSPAGIGGGGGGLKRAEVAERVAEKRFRQPARGTLGAETGAAPQPESLSRAPSSKRAEPAKPGALATATPAPEAEAETEALPEAAPPPVPTVSSGFDLNVVPPAERPAPPTVTHAVPTEEELGENEQLALGGEWDRKKRETRDRAGTAPPEITDGRGYFGSPTRAAAPDTAPAPAAATAPAAHDETRAKLPGIVDEHWKLAVPTPLDGGVRESKRQFKDGAAKEERGEVAGEAASVEEFDAAWSGHQNRGRGQGQGQNQGLAQEAGARFGGAGGAAGEPAASSESERDFALSLEEPRFAAGRRLADESSQDGEANRRSPLDLAEGQSTEKAPTHLYFGTEDVRAELPEDAPAADPAAPPARGERPPAQQPQGGQIVDSLDAVNGADIGLARGIRKSESTGATASELRREEAWYDDGYEKQKGSEGKYSWGIGVPGTAANAPQGANSEALGLASARERKLLEDLQQTIQADSDLNGDLFADAGDLAAQQAIEFAPDGKIALAIQPKRSGEGDAIEVRTWDIPLAAWAKIQAGQAGGEVKLNAKDLLAGDVDDSIQAPAKDALQSYGIAFPEGAAVNYLPSSGTFLAKNTPENLERIDALVKSSLEQAAKEREVLKTFEKSAEEEPYSTFSLHVSDVSFKLAKAALDRGEWPAADQVRVEEFVNAFDYGDPAPTQDEKVACALEQAAHPFLQQRNLLRVSMRTAALGRAAGTPLRLTVLLDNSGSMDRADRAESVRAAFQLLAEQLNPQDQVTLISFARQPRLLADRVAGDNVAELATVVATRQSEGGTNIEEALRLGIAKANEQLLEGGQNRIILLTDGAANLGNAKPEDLAGLVEQMRGQGIAFDACGVGADGLNDEILESLTRKGDGRYYFLDRPEDADGGFAKQIAGALRPAARNVKVQVNFNPKRVGHYKLYGFEKHLLKKEDFRNDSVDAAELAAEEAGNAVYQIETLPEGQGEIGTVSVRFQDTTSGQMVEKKWTIPYDAQTPGLEGAGPSLQLAGAAALLGEKLKGSIIGEAVEMDRLAKLISALPAAFPADDRVQQLSDMAAKIRELAPE